MFSILSRRCPLLATSLSVLFFLLSMLISDSRFDLVWFRLSCNHGWIRSGSVNVRKTTTTNNPPTPDEFTLEMKVDVEGLRMKTILSQPASSQCDPSPRRAAVDTGSEEPGTPQQSPAISTGSEEPGTPARSPAIGTGSEEPGASRALFETNGWYSTFKFHKHGAGVCVASSARRRGRRRR